jgi:sphingomyelin phosphodiesterase
MDPRAFLCIFLGTSATVTPGFWQMTDVHVDLEKECSGTAPNWYGNFNGEYGCGCSVEAVQETASFMHETMAQPDFILFTGDATASGDIMDNMHVIQDGLKAKFTDIPLYLVLGNHDFPGSPVGVDAKAWYKKIADVWGSHLDSKALLELSQFGYYSTTPPVSNSTNNPVRLIALNTELFNHGNDIVVRGETVQEAFDHLAWLNSTLAAVAKAGQRAYVVGHVPIGIETGYANDRRVPSYLRREFLLA